MQNDNSGVVAALAALGAVLLLAVAQATGVLLPMDRLLYPLLAASTQPHAPAAVLQQCNPVPGQPWPRQGLRLVIGAAAADGPLPWSVRQLIDSSQDCLRQAMEVRSAGWAACTLPAQTYVLPTVG